MGLRCHNVLPAGTHGPARRPSRHPSPPMPCGSPPALPVISSIHGGFQPRAARPGSPEDSHSLLDDLIHREHSHRGGLTEAPQPRQRLAVVALVRTAALLMESSPIFRRYARYYPPDGHGCAVGGVRLLRVGGGRGDDLTQQQAPRVSPHDCGDVLRRGGSARWPSVCCWADPLRESDTARCAGGLRGRTWARR